METGTCKRGKLGNLPKMEVEMGKPSIDRRCSIAMVDYRRMNGNPNVIGSQNVAGSHGFYLRKKCSSSLQQILGKQNRHVNVYENGLMTIAQSGHI